MKVKETLAQKVLIASGNEAAAQAILDAGYDGEGYYPITPSSEVGEAVSRAVARGESDTSFIVGTSELAALSIAAGISVAGGRAVDATSSQGLLLKGEEMPVISGLGLPVVMNLATREVSAPLSIKCGHSDLAAALGWGWAILCAPTVQAVYDLNLIALRLAEAANLPVLIAYDGFETSHANRRILVFAEREAVRDFLGEPPQRATLLDVHQPRTFGAYMNEDLINARYKLDEKMARAAEVLPELFEEYAALSGRRYQEVESYGDPEAEAGLLLLTSAGETAKVAADDLAAEGRKVKLILPRVLRPWPEEAILQAIGDVPSLLVAERVSQYGAGNYLANEVGASLQRAGRPTRVLSRAFGISGLAFRPEDAAKLFRLALDFPEVPEEERTLRGYYGAWPGEPDHQPAPTLTPLSAEACTWNEGEKRVNLKRLSRMPDRIDRHSACPGCGTFSNLNLFLRGIDGHVVLLFNTSCGMVVTTGYPWTSFRVPYIHNLFHNAASTATGAVEMYHRLRAKGKLKEEVTFLVVTGDGGDDIGMDQLIGAALRDDLFIVLEYDNKGYMNTGGQLCYTGFLGQHFSNAPLGPAMRGKRDHHKDIVEILRGCGTHYLFSAAESHATDMIRKARKAQAVVRAGHFVFGKVFSVCPLNWGYPEDQGPAIVERAVKSCLHPLYEVEEGVTRLSYNPEARGAKLPVTEAFAAMGRAFSHLAAPEYADLAAQIQQEVDRRWGRLKAMDADPRL